MQRRAVHGGARGDAGRQGGDLGMRRGLERGAVEPADQVLGRFNQQMRQRPFGLVAAAEPAVVIAHVVVDAHRYRGWCAGAATHLHVGRQKAVEQGGAVGNLLALQIDGADGRFDLPCVGAAAVFEPHRRRLGAQRLVEVPRQVHGLVEVVLGAARQESGRAAAHDLGVAVMGRGDRELEGRRLRRIHHGGGQTVRGVIAIGDADRFDRRDGRERDRNEREQDQDQAEQGTGASHETLPSTN